jgi:hypothetical protein
VIARVDVRFTPNATELLRGGEMMRRPEQAQQNPLLDHPIGARE